MCCECLARSEHRTLAPRVSLPAFWAPPLCRTMPRLPHHQTVMSTQPRCPPQSLSRAGRCLLPSFTEPIQERSLRPALRSGRRRALSQAAAGALSHRGGCPPPPLSLLCCKPVLPRPKGQRQPVFWVCAPALKVFPRPPPAARPLHKGGCGRRGAVALPPPARSPRSPPPWAAPRRSASSSSSPPSCRPPGPAEPVRWGWREG